jgi:predicted RNA-binding protein with PIN domain
MPIIIDGHNLLHTIQKTNEELQSISDIQLCQVISKYLKLTGQKGEIVFDGTGPRDKSVFDNIINLEVLFAGQATDADGVIEHKIRLNTAPKRLKIVSSDRRLRKAAQTRKATVTKSETFWKDLEKQLSRRRTIKEPAEKRQGLSESETRQWMRFFGLEQQ